MYTIIEDCSPYYIRFEWDGLNDLVDYILAQPTDSSMSKGIQQTAYKHYNFDSNTALSILNKMPMKDCINFDANRVALFITEPGIKSSIHKDGSKMRCGINITLAVVDDCCKTKWYSDESLSKATKQYNGYSRIRYPIIEPEPIKTTVFGANECILFNTDIYHSWDNSISANTRTVLTLRNVGGDLYFDEVKKLLFGY